MNPGRDDPLPSAPPEHSKLPAKLPVSSRSILLRSWVPCSTTRIRPISRNKYEGNSSLKITKTFLAVLAAFMLAGVGLSASSQANTAPPGTGETCSVYASASFSSTTATVHGAGTDNCVTPRYWLRIEVGINTSSGSPSVHKTIDCNKNINYVEQCAETGQTLSTNNPAGIQTWSYCAIYYYYSSIDFRSETLRKQYCYSARG